MKRFILLAVALAMVCAGTASAQLPPMSRTATGAYGIFVPVFNSTDSLIADGSVVMADTTTAATSNVKRVAIRNYDGTLSNRIRILGIAVGPIQRTTRGGNGQVLIWGYHPRAIVNASNLAATSFLRPAAVNGGLSSGDDSTSMAVGYLVGNVVGTSTGTGFTGGLGVRYRARVWITRIGAGIVKIL